MIHFGLDGWLNDWINQQIIEWINERKNEWTKDSLSVEWFTKQQRPLSQPMNCNSASIMSSIQSFNHSFNHLFMLLELFNAWLIDWLIDWIDAYSVYSFIIWIYQTTKQITTIITTMNSLKWHSNNNNSNRNQWE